MKANSSSASSLCAGVSPHTRKAWTSPSTATSATTTAGTLSIRSRCGGCSILSLARPHRPGAAFEQASNQPSFYLNVSLDELASRRRRRPARALLTSPRRLEGEAAPSRTGTATIQDRTRGGTEGVHEACFDSRAIRLLERTARSPERARACRDRAQRHPPRARRHLYSLLRCARRSPLSGRRHAGLRVVRSRVQGRILPRPVVDDGAPGYRRAAHHHRG